MPLFGSPNIDKLEAKRDVNGLIKALAYRSDGDTPGDPVPGAAAVREAAARALDRLADPRGAAPLVAALGDAYPAVRRAAGAALTAIGAPALDPLIAALRHRESSVHDAAARLLGDLGDPRAVAPLIDALTDRRGPALSAAWALVEIGAPAVDPLIVALRDPDAALADAAAQALGKIGDVRAVAPLLGALTHEQPQVCQAAASGLVQIGAPAIDPLVGALADRSATVRSGAAAALAELGWTPDRGGAGAWYWVTRGEWARAARLGAAAVAPLVVTLREGEGSARVAAVQALGKTGAAQAVPPLIDALSDRDLAVRQAAAAALGQHGMRQADAALRSRAVDALIDALHDRSNAVRQAAAAALGQIGDPSAVAPLIEALNDKEIALRRAATAALVQIGDPRALEPLNRALQDGDPAVRELAADALAKLGWHPDEAASGATYWIVQRQWDRCVEIGAPAVPPLIDALRDEDPDVRRAAAEALGQIAARQADAAVGARAAEPLGVLLRQDPHARQAAAGVLGRIGAPAVRPLIAALEQEGGDEQVRDAATGALAQIGPPAVEALIAALGHKQARTAAARALGQIGAQQPDPAALARAVKPLTAALRDSAYWHRLAAAEALGAITARQTDPTLRSQAVNGLTTALEDAHPQVREAARDALEGLGWEPDAGTAGAAYWITRREWERCVQLGAPAVPPLITVLQDREAAIRAAAAGALVQIGAPAVEPLSRALQNRDAALRCTAVELLGQIGARQTGAALRTRAAEPLIGALRDGDVAVRRAAANALGQAGDAQALDPLISTLQDRDVRELAVAALGEIGARQTDPGVRSRAVEPLISALKDRAAAMRNAAAEALGRIGDPRAASPLVALYRKDPQANQAAGAALLQIGAPAAPPLVAILEEPGSAETLRHAAAGLLVQIGAPSVVPLIAALPNDHARTMVAAVLGDIGDRRAIEPLIATLSDSQRDVRLAAATALSKLGWRPDRSAAGAAYWIALENWASCAEIGAPAVEPLIARLQDEAWQVREGAVDALTRIGDPRAVEPLVALFYAGDVATRLSVAPALGQIGDARAVKPLTAMLEHASSSWGSRKAAAEALVTLYRSGRLDEAGQRLVLAQQPTITQTHADHDNHVDGEFSHDCAHTDRGGHDDTGVGVDFPV